MVCVPCFIIPLLLFLWHRFIQPIVLRFWNPWEKKDEDGNVIQAGPEFPFQCKGGVCPFPIKDKSKHDATNGTNNSCIAAAKTTTEEDTKKIQ
ncbi:UPF0729 protein AAEL015238 [Malaya genurostris]|uniref:UPF0729 protein AAEL015238 n=1 Tax=Malaya genurostris TaxID=325434 RepID=UPI0026F4030C|nr:UPF0729 protein AAEL015238 [Malaya genurostris]